MQTLEGVSGRYLSLTQPLAARMADVSERRLTRWADARLLWPSVDERVTPHRSVRLYGYIELMSLLVIIALLEQKVSLQHIRAVVEHLRSGGYADCDVSGLR